MAIKGSLKEASLPDVIQLLSMGKKTGVLTVTEKDHFGSITFFKGKIVDSYMINRKNRIGELLVASGEMTQEQLSFALERQRQTGEKIGAIILEEKFVQEDLIIKYLKQQIKETIFTMMGWENGYFNFEPRFSGIEKEIISINPETLLLETAKEVDETSEMSIGIIRDISILKPVAHPEDIEKLNNREQKVYSLLDGEKTLELVIESSPFDKFETKDIVSSLVERGLCVVMEGITPQQAEEKITEHLNLGIAFLRTQLYDEAEREFKHIIQLDPGHRQARFYLSVIFTITKNYAEAEMLLRKLNGEHPESIIFMNNLGYILFQKGRFEEAFELFEKASKKQSSGIPYVNIGIIFFNEGDFSKAREYLMKALEINKDMVLPHFYIALIDAVEGRLKKALDRFRDLIKRKPDISMLHYNLGVLNERYGNFEEAEKNYKKALEISPSYIEPRIQLGDLYYSKGLYASARKYYEMIANVGIGDANLFLKLGNIYFREGNKTKAIEAWQKSLGFDPSNEIARRNLEMITQQRKAA